MKHRSPCFLLTLGLVMALGLSACAPATEVQATPSPAPEVSPAPAVPTPEPFASAGDLPEAGSLPLGKYQPWQRGYMDFLSRLVGEEAQLRLWVKEATSAELDQQPDKWEAANMASYQYWLYDVDKDDTPELFIRYGSGEAAYETVCYTYHEGEVAAIGDFPSGHSTLCTCPGENGVIFLWTHLGVSFADRYAVEEGQLVDKGQVYGVDLSAAQMDEAPAPGEVWEGSEELPFHYTRTCLWEADSPALLLPICDYDRALQQAPALTEEAQVRDAIGKVLWDGERFLGASGDNLYGIPGLLTLEEYRQSVSYSDYPMVIEGQAWADVNGDGQTDCILRLYLPERNWDMDFHLVLSWQEGQVYGYYFDGISDVVVDPDGSVYLRDWAGWRQVSFYKEQSYTFPSADPVVGDGLAWDSFSQ